VVVPRHIHKAVRREIRAGWTDFEIAAQPFLVRDDEEFGAAFAEMEHGQVQAVIVRPSLVRERLADLALKFTVPAVSANRLTRAPMPGSCGHNSPAWINPLDADYLNPVVLDRAHELARKAVQLDPKLPDAHAVFGARRQKSAAERERVGERSHPMCKRTARVATTTPEAGSAIVTPSTRRSSCPSRSFRGW
jgi:hypothetical protein